MLLGLSLRLGVLVTEVERLPIPVIAEYMAFLNPAEPEPNVEADLMRVFGGTNRG